MSLAFTLPSKALMWYFLDKKVYYKLADEASSWEAWAEDAASGTEAE